MNSFLYVIIYTIIKKTVIIMRFQKRITIAKGLSLNISKSGISFTGGIRGASINVGSKGVFLNTGIPGTGLSDRRQLLGAGGKPSGKKTSASKKTDIDVSISVSLDEMGNPVIYDEHEREITDEKVLKKIKKTEYYTELVDNLISKKKEELEDETAQFINIYKYTPSIMTEEEIKNSKFPAYEMKLFTKPAPTLEECRSLLEEKAKKEVASVFFWTNDKKRKEYVESHLSWEYQKLIDKWKEEKRLFEEKEEERKREEELKRKEELEKVKAYIEEKSPEDYINNATERFLADITLPAEFSINYEFNSPGRLLMVDLDLPEIEALPQKKAAATSRSKLTIKEKTTKELQEDYARCVTGMAFFFAGNLFNISASIEKILISGYTQRLSKKTGNRENEYIYSIIFERGIFSKLNVSNIDPVEGFSNFKNRIKLSAGYEMKGIEPFTDGDA